MNVHLIGIGGAGMSGIARVLAQRGDAVSGCDRAWSALTAALEREGIACREGHDPAHLEGCERVIVSGAIPDDAPELARARELGLAVEHRADALAGILSDHAARVVVTGAHGKTTTTSMLAFAAVELGLDPTFVVGGDVRQLGTNARGGSGTLAIVEGDESDRSVQRLPATIGVILNVDFDHLDHYDSLEDVEALLGAWAGSIPPDGFVVLGDGVAVEPAAEVARFGVGPGDGLRALDAAADGEGVAFRPSRGPERVRLAVPGVHNAGNACAAALVLERLGAPLGDAFAALERFTGAGRRFEVIGSAFGYTVVDDYAHHPTELAAAIAAARGRDPKRLVVLFQPHMPWRTKAFAEEFAAALDAADRVVVLETYVARGAPDPDASARRIAQLLDMNKAVFVANGGAAAREIQGIARSGDLILCCGAGPVDEVARRILE
ncbi:MAG: UDP-N-acetylmuramate--L-alanine ligase [Gaiellales bacterium]